MSIAVQSMHGYPVRQTGGLLKCQLLHCFNRHQKSSLIIQVQIAEQHLLAGPISRVV